MKIVLGCDDKVAAWASERLGIAPMVGPLTAFGVIDSEGVIHGAIVFTNYNTSNIDATVVGPRCFTRNIIRAAADYCFNQLKCNRVTFRTKRKNKLACRILAKHIGPNGFEGVAKSYYGREKKDDAIIYRLDRNGAVKWCGVF